MPEITKMTSKGQVVIPVEIREELSLDEGTQLVVSRMGDLVLMKKISIADPKKEFEELTKKGSSFAKKKGIKDEHEVVKRIMRGRGVRSD
jgi:antitoxin PrlF